ncbi:MULTISPECIES: tetratricopeptide repeat protein [Pseudoalteromonas]|uniref:Tetratricopeptide repeat protein n=1 Tax=Pseudoalteromonas amylolytica TaxID=1859457 RepID=A0A1S1N1I3_9GAMM|nr:MULTISPECIES: hypothetical protein [Pseudoalteromonas]OHU91824.1 hypothetical protein BFC16_02360 [Pseudoalteromonas sp. JW3]OHU93150.1 hypothetical protein BET10_02270 [Pseudoalteromonas amylolytica]
MKQLFALSLILFLTACNHTQKIDVKEPLKKPSTLLNHSLFTRLNIESEESIFALPEAERHKFLSYAQEQKLQNIRADTIIANYLDSNLDKFTYDGATLNATATLAMNEGNCISLAILTQAYANMLGIETSFKEVATMPVYKKQNQTILVSNHFKTKLYAPREQEDEKWLYAIRPGTVIDYFPARDLVFIGSATYADLVAKYYANLATEALLAEQFDMSYSLVSQALEYVPYDPELINLAAILHRRVGDTDTAKKLFEFALNNQLVSNNLLYSYSYLAQQLADTPLQEKLEEQLLNNAKTPFDFLQLAEQDIAKERYSSAEALLKELIASTPYIPEPYFALAKIYYLQDKKAKAAMYLQYAIDKSEDREKQGVYQAKLNTLEYVGRSYNQNKEQN